ncbi:zinc ribbon domain-containing protein [Teredinibacter sp. KSP-S5-2]|uniref:FmdB family zinc ribbon protein n=1 Tax=Teredinibacter sp. KSP-S5-2 TaxID=3034506 RepID=UPI002934418B|nr:zinc ribbon domain-containing protein [Teredinibacter sp. KSP-S5-2]WNO09682.1 zinc ribbon domain-containing protein [Teredinibacter sp. KSP-S5-2]
MPIYEYRCDACEHELEALQKMSDGPLVDCPVCEKPELKKKISAAAFRLKGGGWYETDFKKSGDKKKNLAGDKDSSSKSASTPSKKDSQSGAAQPSSGSPS